MGRHFSEFVVVMLLFGIITSAYMLGYSTAEGKLKSEAVKRGFAEYSKQTGVWQWKESEAAK